MVINRHVVSWWYGVYRDSLWVYSHSFWIHEKMNISNRSDDGSNSRYNTHNGEHTILSWRSSFSNDIFMKPHDILWYIIYIMLNDHHIVTVYVTISIAVHPRRVHHRPGPSWAMVSSGHWDSPLFCSRVAAPVPCFLLAKTNMEQSSDGFDCIYISIIIYIYE